MERTIKLTASVVGGLALLCVSPPVVRAQVTTQPVTRLASLAPGSIAGFVSDERGEPVAGVLVSALGGTTAVAVSDRSGRFELRTLTPGPYVLRAHLPGFVASRGQVVEVRSSSRSSSTIALRRVEMTAVSPATMPVLTAGLGLQGDDAAGDPMDAGTSSAASAGNAAKGDSHSEVAFRLRHARRGILKDVDIPEEILVSDTPPDSNIFGRGSFLGYMGSPARAAGNWFAGTPFSGEVNLLTTGSFESPEQLFTTDNFSRSIAYLALGAPVGDGADWTVRAALTQGDLASWIVAGEYASRAPSRHQYDLGWSYATQRYDGGNFATLRAVKDGSRNAGLVFGYDTFAITPAISLSYGARYARYDYLEDRGMFSPRASLTVEPIDQLRVSGMLSRRVVAPGAEEFMPRMDSGVWLPPQRTFASLDPAQPLRPERVDHMEVGVERDIAAATVSVRAFRQRIDDQLVTVFGLDEPGISSHLGHYFIGSAGDIEASGVAAGVRGSLGERMRASVEWSTVRGQALGTRDMALFLVAAPSVVRTELERIYDVATTVETEVPETLTRVVVLYRLSNAFARPGAGAASADRPSVDARFDVQVRQSLPFMDFSTAKWEMLVGVRNFFRETAADQSIYDELLVVRPPKRVVGGLTLKF